jgi:hypothetical protein
MAPSYFKAIAALAAKNSVLYSLTPIGFDRHMIFRSKTGG